MQKYGDRIRQIRKELGMTQAEFGEKIGVSGGNISRYEKSEYEPTAPVLKALENAYGLRPEWILTGDGEPRASRSRQEELADILSKAMVGNTAKDQLLRAFARLPDEAFPKMLEYIQQLSKLIEEEQ